MTLDELLEHAVLDALALLDEQDVALFERSFHAASPEVQRRVREIQASVSTDPLFLSVEDPDAALRGRTVRAAAARFERSRMELEPVAFVAEGRAMLPRRRLGVIIRSAAIWQAASFALLAGLVTSTIFYVKAVGEADRMARNLASLQISDTVREAIGSAPWAIMNRAETKVALASSDRGAVGSVFVDEGSKMVIVVAYGLPATGAPPVLQIVDDSGTEVMTLELAYSEAGLRVGYAKLAGDLTTAALTQCAFAVVDGNGRVLLS
jgi:hypothetical protein